jgi:AraC family transcriptional regulator
MRADDWSGPPFSAVSCPGKPDPGRIHVDRPWVVMVDAGDGSCSYAAHGVRRRVSFRPGRIEIYSPLCDLERYTRNGSMTGTAVDVSALSALGAGLDPRPLRLRSQLGIDDIQLVSILTCMRAEIASRCPNGRLFAQSLTASLAQLLASRYSVDPARNGRVHKPPAQRLGAVRDFILDNLAADLTLEDIADVAQLSPSQLVRSFRAEFGISPHRFVTAKRVAEAKRLLETSQLPVTDIAMALGFASPSHFSATFRRVTGVTPSDFRGAPP